MIQGEWKLIFERNFYIFSHTVLSWFKNVFIIMLVVENWKFSHIESVFKIVHV